MIYFYTSDSTDHVNCSANNPKERNVQEVEDYHIDSFDDEEESVTSIITKNGAEKYLSQKKRCWINFRWYFCERRAWEEDDIPIATEKVELCYGEDLTFDLNSTRGEESSIKVQETLDVFEVWVRNEEDRFMKKCATIDKETGEISSFCNHLGEDILLEPIRPNFTRAPTDNDRGGIDRVNGKLQL